MTQFPKILILHVQFLPLRRRCGGDRAVEFPFDVADVEVVSRVGDGQHSRP